MINFFLKLIYFIGRLLGRFKTFVADYPVDNPPIFRYPHLLSISKCFQYDSEIDCFVLKDLKDAQYVANIILSNEITLYELINKKAKKLHLNDFLGYKSTDCEKLKALVSVVLSYIKNKFYLLFGENSFNLLIDIKNITKNDFRIKEEFSDLKHFQNNFSKTNAVFVKIKGLNRIFQIGVTLKGTNFIFVDHHPSTFFQELYHCNYHFEEGIKGFNNDNKYIVETWASVPWLYLIQCIYNRIERRIRKNKSPHDIKFIDYVYWRAYIGQGYIFRTRDLNQPLIFHGVYGLIAPTAKLLFSSIKKNKKVKNKLIIDAIFKGPAPEIKQYVNRFLGGKYFETIFHDFNLFSRLESINKIIAKNSFNQEEIYKILFNDEELVPSLLHYRLVALIWISKKINTNKNLVIDLIENFYNIILNNESQPQKITIERWINYLEKKNKKLSELVSNEFKKYQFLIKSI